MNVSLDMSFEAVERLTNEAIRNGAADFDPTLPLYQWQALHAIVALQEQFEGGDQYALMLAIRKCAQCEVPLPEWSRKAYIAAFDTVHTYQAKSWDEVFGTPFPKGQHLHAARRDRALRWEVLERVRELRRSRPIDEGMFAAIGKELGASKTTVSNLYYEFSEDMRALP